VLRVRRPEPASGVVHADPGLASAVDMKLFCGFPIEEIAAPQAVSERTVQRQWGKARLPSFRLGEA
jgi:hypothetical protein